MCLSFTHSKFKIDNVNKSKLHYQLILKKFLDNLKYEELSDEYIYSNKKTLMNFLKYLMINDVSHISRITNDNIFKYISALDRYSQSYKYDIVSKIRIFLKFMYLSNFTSVDFTLAIPKIKINHNNKIPHTIWSADEISKILNSIDTATKDESFSPQYSFYHIFKKYLKLANIDISNKKYIGTYSLRHSLATTLLQNKTPLSTISGILGHTDINNTAIYLKVDISSLRECCLNLEVD